jgi:hypothetical protein
MLKCLRRLLPLLLQLLGSTVTAFSTAAAAAAAATVFSADNVTTTTAVTATATIRWSGTRMLGQYASTHSV